MKNFCGGAVIYAKDPQRVAAFFEQVAGLAVSRLAGDHVVLESDSFQLVVLQVPAGLAKTITLTSPPARRELAAIKPVFFVASLAAAREVAGKFGGLLNPPRREWQFDGWTVCDGNDPEGNVFQLRERKVRDDPI